MSLTEFVLGAATEVAEKVLGSERIVLGEAASLQAAKALRRPARVVPEVVKLFEEP